MLERRQVLFEKKIISIVNNIRNGSFGGILVVGILDSPPSYRKTLKYFRALWQTADPRSSFSFSRILGSPPLGTLRFPTEFGLFSRIILILNCSRGKFQQKNH